MKERILKNRTLSRALFLILGSVIIIQSILDQQWPGILFGSYLASMGLFSFGCASGNCYNGNCSIANKPVPDRLKNEPENLNS